MKEYVIYDFINNELVVINTKKNCKYIAIGMIVNLSIDGIICGEAMFLGEI